MYTPSETVSYEKKVKACFYQQGGQMIPETKTTLDDNFRSVECTTPIKVEIWAFLEPPKSSPKYKILLMLRNFIGATKKPDIDNIAKIVLDGLTGAAWKDDSAVTDLTVHKSYDEVPRVVVEINRI